MSRSRSRKPGLIISNNKTSLFLEIFNASNLNAFQFTANSENILLFLSSKHTVCIQLMTLPYWPDGDGGMDHKDTIDNVDGMIIVLWLRKKVAINPRVLCLRHDVWIVSVDSPLFPVWTARCSQGMVLSSVNCVTCVHQYIHPALSFEII